MSAETTGTDLERNLGHKLATGIGLVMLAGLWSALFQVEDALFYKFVQVGGLLGGVIAFGAALGFARGRREEFRIGWAFLGSIVMGVLIHASLLIVTGSSPTSETTAYSFGSSVGLAFPYLLVAYGWKGAEAEGGGQASAEGQPS